MGTTSLVGAGTVRLYGKVVGPAAGSTASSGFLQLATDGTFPNGQIVTALPQNPNQFSSQWCAGLLKFNANIQVKPIPSGTAITVPTEVTWSYTLADDGKVRTFSNYSNDLNVGAFTIQLRKP